MEEAARRLGETIKAKFRELNEEESYTGNKLPRTLDLHAFSWLADTVTFQAIQRLSTEWQTTKSGCQDGSLQAMSDICTSCEILLRFGLPCKHYLRQICLNGSPIPRSLLHPRWWLQGEPVKIADWSPLYQTVDLPSSSQNPIVQNPFLSPTRTQMTGLGLQVIEARDNLTGYARQRYENAAAQAQRGLVEFAQELTNNDLHVRMPDAVKRSSWRRQFKTHDKVNKRLMTGAEAAERDANNREQAVAQEARQEASQEANIALTWRPPPSPNVESIPNTSPRGFAVAAAVTAAAAAATATTVDRPSSHPQEEKEEEEEEEAIDRAFIPPPSTAPAAMTQSRAGRKRAPTMKALEAEQASKRGTGQGRGKDKGKGRARGRGGAA